MLKCWCALEMRPSTSALDTRTVPVYFVLSQCRQTLTKHSMTESHFLSSESDRYAAEMFDAQRAEILAFFLVGVCEDPADRVSASLACRSVVLEHKGNGDRVRGVL